MISFSRTIIDVADATTNQTSDTFVIPARFKMFSIFVSIIAGDTPDLKFQVDRFIPGLDAWNQIIGSMPGGSLMTTIGVFETTFHNHAAVNGTATAELNIPLGGQMRIIMTHNDTAAVTYKAIMMPL